MYFVLYIQLKFNQNIRMITSNQPDGNMSEGTEPRRILITNHKRRKTTPDAYFFQVQYLGHTFLLTLTPILEMYRCGSRG